MKLVFMLITQFALIAFCRSTLGLGFWSTQAVTIVWTLAFLLLFQGRNA